MTSPALGALWQQSTLGVKVVRNADRPAPEAWRPWLAEMFPKAVSRPMAPHHVAFWEYIWAIDYLTAPRPWLSIWSREGGKSTNIECATVALGVRGARRYAMYVRQTQDTADNSVANIAAKLESPAIEVYYPKHAMRLLSKHGTSKGWRRNRLRTAGGFTIDAMGLDAAMRGAKVEDDRPDLVILDDLDTERDSPGTIAKKLRTLTTAILPAGAQNVAVIGAQNLIHAEGLFTRLVDGRADFLTDRQVSGPHPAVKGLKWEWKEDPEGGVRKPVITAGKPTWEGQSIATCERQMRLWGPTAFLREAQHEVMDRAEGLALNFDPAEHFADLTHEEVLELVALGRNFGGIDFGSWRFGFQAWAADTAGVAFRTEELFSQREEAAVRAMRIHYLCERLGIVRGFKLRYRFPIWGDNANPSDITEMNAAWKRGWRDPVTGKRVVSPLRVIGVGHGEKFIRAAVTRINDKMGERAIRLVRSVGASHRWLLGYNAGSPGTEKRGSRLVWELQHWGYAVPPEGKVDLKQNPDDHTADGADEIATMRYALMSWWNPAAKQDDEDFDAWSPEALEVQHHETQTLLARRSRKKPRRVIDEGDY